MAKAKRSRGLGVTIPVVSKFLVSMKIRKARRATDRAETLCNKAMVKMSDAVAAAKREDIKSKIDEAGTEARRLQDICSAFEAKAGRGKEGRVQSTGRPELSPCEQGILREFESKGMTFKVSGEVKKQHLDAYNARVQSECGGGA